MDTLFDFATKNLAPLADRMRPTTLDEFVGQEHIVGENTLLRRAIKTGTLGSCIFYGGPGCGKTTLAKGLFQHYKGVYFEQNMIPEFGIPDNVDEGKYEEEVLWESSVELLKYFHNKGIKNIIGLDFNDLRTREIPTTFKGTNFITLKLISSDYEQNKN